MNVKSITTSLAESLGNRLIGCLQYGNDIDSNSFLGTSGTHLLICLKDKSFETLQTVKSWMNSIDEDVRPMLLTSEEIHQSADVFAVKFREIKKYHVVLHGVDPLAELVIDHEHLLWKSEQELRNAILKLRNRFVTTKEFTSNLEGLLRSLNPIIHSNLSLLMELKANRSLELDEVMKEAQTQGLDLDALSRYDRWYSERKTLANEEFFQLLDETMKFIESLIFLADQQISK